MNFKGVILGAKVGAKHVFGFCKRHLPQIMVGAGVAGFVGTAVASGKAALKAKEVLDRKDAELNQINHNEPDAAAVEKAIKKQAAIDLCKTFALPVTLGAASTALVFGGHHIMGRRAAAALASAYEAQKRLFDYNSNVVNQLGEETARKLQQGIAINKEKAAEDLKKIAENEKNEPEKSKEQTKGPLKHVEFFFGRATCGFGGGWHDDAFKVWSKIRNAYAFCLDRLKIQGHLSVNEILWSEFSYPSVGGGNAGWIWDERGYGCDEDMEWRIHTHRNTWTIKDFISEEGLHQFRQDPFNEVWIDFVPKHSSDDLDRMCACINERKKISV